MKRKFEEPANFLVNKITTFNHSECVVLTLGDFFPWCHHEQDLLCNKFQSQAKGKIKWLEHRYNSMINPPQFIPIEFCRDYEYILHVLEAGSVLLDKKLVNIFHPCLFQMQLFRKKIREIALAKLQDISNEKNFLLVPDFIKSIGEKFLASDCEDERDESHAVVRPVNSLREHEMKDFDNEEYVLNTLSKKETPITARDIICISDRLRNNYEFMLKIFKTCNFGIDAVRCIPTSLSSTSQFLIELSKLTPYSFACMSQSEGNINTIMEVIENNPFSIKYYHSRNKIPINQIRQEMKEKIIKTKLDRLQYDKEFIIKCLLINIGLIEYISPPLLKDREFMIEVAKTLQHQISHLPEQFFQCAELIDDSQYMLLCISITEQAFQKVSPRLSANKKFILEALKLNNSIYENISLRLLLEDRDFLFKCLAITGKIVILSKDFTCK